MSWPKSYIFLIVAAVLCFLMLELNSQVIFEENFDGSGAIPAGWSVYDEDHIQGSGTYQQHFSSSASGILSGGNSVWNAITWSDYRFSSAALGATSSFQSDGQADDWVVSPPVTLGSNTYLFWSALSTGPFPQLDDYEVRASNTPITPDNNPGTLIFSSTAPATRGYREERLHLASLGFASQAVYLAWRHVGNGGNVLLIDDIKVVDAAAPYADAGLSPIGDGRTLMMPLAQVVPILPEVKVANRGLGPVTGVAGSVHIFDRTFTLIHSSALSGIPSIPDGSEDMMSASAPWTPPDTGEYFLQYTVSITESDQVSHNDTLIEILLVTDSVYASDNGVTAGALGFAGGGAFGRELTIHSGDHLTSISVALQVDSSSTIGREISGGVFAMYSDTPIFRIAQTEKHTIDDTGSALVHLPIQGGPLLLDPGKFTFVVDVPKEINESLVRYSLQDEQLQENWISYNYTDWFHTSETGLSASFIIRPNFSNRVKCLPPKNPLTLGTSPTAALLQWDEVNLAAGYEVSGFLTGSDTSDYISRLRVGQSNTSYQINGLCTDKMYDWRVRSVCSVNGVISYSDYTQIQSFQTSACAQPDSIAVTDITAGSATLTWSYVTGAMGYLITGQAIGGAITYMIVPGGQNTSLELAGLPVSTAFVWQVQAGCALQTPCSGGLPVLSTSLSGSFSTLATGSKSAGEEKVNRSGIGVAAVYPNPTSNAFVVEFHPFPTDIDRYRIQVYDMGGRRLIDHYYADTAILKRNIFVGDLPNGVYQVVFKSYRSISFRRIVVSR